MGGLAAWCGPRCRAAVEAAAASASKGAEAATASASGGAASGPDSAGAAGDAAPPSRAQLPEEMAARGGALGGCTSSAMDLATWLVGICSVREAAAAVAMPPAAPAVRTHACRAHAANEPRQGRRARWQASTPEALRGSANGFAPGSGNASAAAAGKGTRHPMSPAAASAASTAGGQSAPPPAAPTDAAAAAARGAASAAGRPCRWWPAGGWAAPPGGGGCSGGGVGAGGGGGAGAPGRGVRSMGGAPGTCGHHTRHHRR